MTSVPRDVPGSELNMSGQDSWRVFRIMAEFVEGFESLAASAGPSRSLAAPAPARRTRTTRLPSTPADCWRRPGLAVITGGGPGIMEAANKGAFEAGGTSVGCNITLPHEQEANRYQTSRSTSITFTPAR